MPIFFAQKATPEGIKNALLDNKRGRDIISSRTKYHLMLYGNLEERCHKTFVVCTEGCYLSRFNIKLNEIKRIATLLTVGIEWLFPFIELNWIPGGFLLDSSNKLERRCAFRLVLCSCVGY